MRPACWKSKAHGSLPFVLAPEEKGWVHPESCRDEIEELEQTLFNIDNKIVVGQHILSGRRVVSLNASQAQD